MRVKELKLHNFRGIKDLPLVFNPDRNGEHPTFYFPQGHKPYVLL
ncbi:MULTISPECIES: hypothetical protein [unclassified Chamaesiphon]|nr:MULTISPECIES: hypothetical protein [unclassified Chamaesiphon]